jgi:septal ring factor EnvC (AmiA/AmiB activator)
MTISKQAGQAATILSVLTVVVGASMWVSAVSDTAHAADEGVKELRNDIKQVPADVAVLKQQVADLKDAIAKGNDAQAKRDEALLAAVKANHHQ